MPLASKFIRTRKVPGMLASDAMVQNDHGRVSSYNGIMEHVKMLQVVMDQCWSDTKMLVVTTVTTISPIQKT